MHNTFSLKSKIAKGKNFPLTCGYWSCYYLLSLLFCDGNTTRIWICYKLQHYCHCHVDYQVRSQTLTSNKLQHSYPNTLPILFFLFLFLICSFFTWFHYLNPHHLLQFQFFSISAIFFFYQCIISPFHSCFAYSSRHNTNIHVTS